MQCVDCGKDLYKGKCKSCIGRLAKAKTVRPLEDRFWEKVNKDGPIMPHMDSPCWMWTSAKTPQGYGYITIKRGKSKKAHRISYEIHCGPIPDGQQVLHRCDNPPCVNPEHFFLGTNLDNVRDKVSKGRSPSLKGELNPSAKITQGQANEIKYKYAQGEASQRALAREYKITQTAVWYIVNNEHWS